MKKLYLTLVLITSFMIPRLFELWIANSDYVNYYYTDLAYMKADIVRLIICCIFWVISVRLLHKWIDLDWRKDIIPVLCGYIFFILAMLILSIVSYDNYAINNNDFVEFINEKGYEFIFQALVLGGLGVSIYFNDEENLVKSRILQMLIISFILIISYNFIVINDYNEHLLLEQKRNLNSYYENLYEIKTYSTHEEITKRLNTANEYLHLFNKNTKTCNNNITYKIRTLQSEVLYNAAATRRELEDGIRREYAYYTIDEKYAYLLELLHHVENTDKKIYETKMKQRVYIGIYFYSPFEKEVLKILEDEVKYLESELNVTILW